MGRRGESIFHRKDGRWEARYSIGRSTATGATQYRSVYGRTYSEAKEKRRSAMQQAYEQRKNGYFSDTAWAWLSEKEQDVKEQTYLKYLQCIKNHILPFFGEMRCSAVTQATVDNFLACKRESGRISGRGGLSQNTIRGMAIILQSILVFGTQKKMGIAVPIQIKKPRAEKKAVSVLKPYEQQKLETILLKTPTGLNLAIYLAIHTGMRIGEICAIRWENVDFYESLIYVQGTVIRNKYRQTAIAPPKSETSQRKIPVTAQLAQLLKAEKARSSSEYVFPAPQSGKLLNPRTLQYRLQAILNQQQLPKINFHALRHTFATRWIECGLDVKSLSEVLGHASIQTTLDIYVHSSDKLKREAMERLESFSGHYSRQ